MPFIAVGSRSEPPLARQRREVFYGAAVAGGEEVMKRVTCQLLHLRGLIGKDEICQLR